MPLGQTLADLRKNAKMTQSELGEKLNISAQAISKWENNTSEPDIATIRKLAEIYNVSVSYIIDPENVNISEHNDSILSDDAPEYDNPFDSLFDVYITKIDTTRKIKAISYLMNLLGCGLTEAKNAVENLPFCISGMIDDETGKRIVSYFEAVGVTVSLTPSKGLIKRSEIKSLDTPEPPKESHDMKRRFTVANITAGIPAIALMIFMFMISSSFGDVLLSLYLGISTYSVIFLLWYPTLTRKLLSPIRALFSAEGFFGTIGAILLFIVFIPWLVAVALISPINYILTIKTRIARMLDEDLDDDIFTVEFEKELKSFYK